MPTLTPNYSLQKPIPGADDDLWGNYLNNALDIIDTEMKANADAAAAIIGTIYPVGSIYISTNNVNPNTVLGLGTWVAFAEGRVLVGAGNNGESTWTEGEERGSETHSLDPAENGPHNHSIDPPSTPTDTNGGHSHVPTNGGSFLDSSPGGAGVDFGGAGASGFSAATNNTGFHTHNVDIAPFFSGISGSGLPHNNVQPSLGVYMWERTA